MAVLRVCFGWAYIYMLQQESFFENFVSDRCKLRLIFNKRLWNAFKFISTDKYLSVLLIYFWLTSHHGVKIGISYWNVSFCDDERIKYKISTVLLIRRTIFILTVTNTKYEAWETSICYFFRYIVNRSLEVWFYTELFRRVWQIADFEPWL